MEVLEKRTTPGGTKIQIENWCDDYSFHRFADLIAAYPICKNSVIKRRFRAECQFENASKASEAFYALVSGKKTLDDFPFTAKMKGNDVPFRQYVPLQELYPRGW